MATLWPFQYIKGAYKWERRRKQRVTGQGSHHPVILTAAELLSAWAAPRSSQGCIIEGVLIFQHKKDVEWVRRRPSGCSEDWSSSAMEMGADCVQTGEEEALRWPRCGPSST